MAIYYFNLCHITRRKKLSAVGRAAYMSCSRMRNERTGVLYNYTRKPGLVWQAVFLPDNAPQAWADRSVLWNAVEAKENAVVGHLAREVVVALPIELSVPAWISLLTDYIREQYVALGMCADVSIHNTDGTNPHAHILLTSRPLEADGSWAQKAKLMYVCKRDAEQKLMTNTEYQLVRNDGWQKQYCYLVGGKKQFMTPDEAAANGYPLARKDPRNYNLVHPLVAQWRSVEQLMAWRKAWADVVNRYLQSAGSAARIDHRSYKEQGIDLIPMIHEGPAARRIEARGGISRRCEKNRQIRAENARIREHSAQNLESHNIASTTATPC